MSALDCKIYVGNLPLEATESDLDEAFSYFGPITKIWVARNPPGFAFVEFKDPLDAKDAVLTMQGKRICGSIIKVEHSSGKKRTQPKPLIPHTTNAKGEPCYTLKGMNRFNGQNEFANDEKKSANEKHRRKRSKSSHSGSSTPRSRDESCYYCRHRNCRCSPRRSRRYSSRSSHSSGHSRSKRRHRSRTRSLNYDSDCRSCRICDGNKRYSSSSRSRSRYRSSRSRSGSQSSLDRHRRRSRHRTKSSSCSSDRSPDDRKSKRAWSRSVSSERHYSSHRKSSKEKR